MAKITRTQHELELLFNEQLDFVKSSSASFDNGFESEIKRLAVSVRVTAHDTDTSTSLLTLLDKKSTAFLDTSDPYDDENILSHSSLVQTCVTDSGLRIRANLDEHTQPKWITFDAWWNGVVLVDSIRNEFSRKDIVLYLANKDGGAHVDHEIDEKYHNLRVNNSLSWFAISGDGHEIAGQDHVPATMRQIAHELLKSFDPGYHCEQVPIENTRLVVSGMSVIFGEDFVDQKAPNLRKDRVMIGGRKVGRNDTCPCGSGRKFKRCCI